jgi:hypothetical protein
MATHTHIIYHLHLYNQVHQHLQSISHFVVDNQDNVISDACSGLEIRMNNESVTFDPDGDLVLILRPGSPGSDAAADGNANFDHVF